MLRNILFLVAILVCSDLEIAASITHHSRKQRHHKLHQAGWAGAGLAAGQAVGPAGSAVVGTAKYRKDLKAGGHRRTRAVAKIAGPIAAGAVAGPVGSVSYAAVEHRNWIKRHLFHRKRQPGNK
jgi:hypothetical protein